MLEKEPKEGGKKSYSLEIEKLEEAAGKLRAIAHPVRIAIIRYIEENESANVTDIYQTLGLEQAVASQHLTLLRRKGLLTVDKVGQCCYYALRYDQLSDIVRCIERCSEGGPSE